MTHSRARARRSKAPGWLVSLAFGWLVSMYHARSLCFSDPDSPRLFLFFFFNLSTPPTLVLFVFWPLCVSQSCLCLAFPPPFPPPSVYESSSGRIGRLIGKADLDFSSSSKCGRANSIAYRIPDETRKRGVYIHTTTTLDVMEGRAQVDRVTRGTVWMPRREPLANGCRLRAAELGYWPIDPGAALCCHSRPSASLGRYRACLR